MTITRDALIRSSAAAAVAAGVIFIGVQVGHPTSELASVTSTEWAVRNSLKVLMAGLALAGITGMYLRQVRQVGRLGLVGYLVFAVGYLSILAVSFVSAYVLPSLAATSPAYVSDLLAEAIGNAATGDIGSMKVALGVSGLTFLGGGLLFGIAMYRARVLARWACALLAVGSVVTVLLAVLPDAFYRLLAFPNGLAMIGLGFSLWLSTRPEPSAPPVGVAAPAQVAAV